jgi:hypothetical protein
MVFSPCRLADVIKIIQTQESSVTTPYDGDIVIVYMAAFGPPFFVCAKGPFVACAVQRRRFSVGPTRQQLLP